MALDIQYSVRLGPFASLVARLANWKRRLSSRSQEGV